MAKKPAGKTPDVEHLLGRHTQATMGLWGELVRAIPRYPFRFAGPRPRQSPNLRRFDYGYPAGSPDDQDISEYFQVRGFCVGWGTAHLGENEDGTPEEVTESSRWTRPIRYSPGYSYALSREQAVAEGVNLGSGDGAIVSHAVMAAAKHGFLPWADWPSDSRSEESQSNRKFPTANQKQAGAKHAIGSYTLHDGPESILTALGSGRLVVVGTDWLQGMAQTDSEGGASVSGGSLGGHCVIPETIIGAPVPKRADAVKVGDLVFGHDGLPHRVSTVHTRPYRGDLIRVRAVGTGEVQMTPDHPVLAYRPLRAYGIVVRPGTDLANYGGDGRYAKLAPRVVAYEAAQPEWIPASALRPGDYLLSPRPKLPEAVVLPEWLPVHAKTKPPNPIKRPDSGLAWLMGQYVADGNVHGRDHRKWPKSICITMSSAEHVERATAVVRSLGLEPSVRDHGTYFRFKVFNSSLARRFEEWFGRGSRNKQMPMFLFHGWDLAAFLEGVQDGDGTRSIDGLANNVISTTSETLFWQLWQVLLVLGKKPQYCYQVRKGFGVERGIWHLRWNDRDTNEQARLWRDFYAMPVRSVLATPYEGTVFNYDVEAAQTYVANGAIVHNCYVLLDYDEDRDLLWYKNSHPQYGARESSNRRYSGSSGYSNVAVVKLSAYMRVLMSASKMRSGQSEALSVAGRGGFAPRVKIEDESA